MSIRYLISTQKVTKCNPLESPCRIISSGPLFSIFAVIVGALTANHLMTVVERTSAAVKLHLVWQNRYRCDLVTEDDVGACV